MWEIKGRTNTDMNVHNEKTYSKESEAAEQTNLWEVEE